MPKNTRLYTEKLLDMVSNGEISADLVVNLCVGYMSEDDVKEMMEANDLIEDEEVEDEVEDEDEEVEDEDEVEVEEDDPLDDFGYVGSRHHY